jgi:hypothetical protein
MAADPNRDTFLKQLSEMRALRSQQLQAGGQQMQALGRQTAMMSNMNNTLARQSQTLSQLNNSLSRGFSGLAKSIGGLSSAVTRGAASTVAAVGRGAGGAVGSAAAGVGKVSSSAVSGITHGIVSSLSYALPTAIAGVIGKSLIWDNIDDGTKKEMGENIGGIFKNVFGDSLKPVTKELKVMTMTLADTLESLGDTIGGVVAGIKGRMPALKEGAKDRVSSVTSRASDAAEKVRENIPHGARVAKIMGEDVSKAAKKGYDIATSITGPDATGAKGVAAGVGAIAVGKKTANVLQESAATAKGVEKAAGAKNSITKLAMDLLKKDGSKVTKASLLAARVVARLTLMSGPVVSKLLGAILKYKLAKWTAVLSLVIEGGMYWLIASEVEAMMQEGVLNAEEGKSLIELARKQAAYSSAGALALGGIGAAAGSGLLSIPLGIGGSVLGGIVGNKIAEATTKLPESLKQEYEETKKEAGTTGSVNPATVANKKKAKTDKKAASAVSKPSAGATEGKKGENGTAQKAMEYFMSRGWTKEQAAGIVGNLQAESSSFNTTAVGDNGQAVGIAQWHPDRQQRFKEIFKKDIKDASFEEQMAFVDYELNNQEKVAGDLLRNAKTADEAAAIIDKYYERSKGTALNKRQQNALALMGGGAQTTMMASAGGGAQSGGDVVSGLPTNQVSAAQKPTAGMNVSQKMDYYRNQIGDEKGPESTTAKAGEPKQPGLLEGFKNAFDSSNSDSLTAQLMKGIEGLMEFDVKAKKEAASGGSVVTGGDTTIVNNNTGGGGGGAPAYNPIMPAASYQSQFTSLAGIQRTA